MFRCAIKLVVLTLLPAVCSAQTGVPFTMARATQYDMTSRINGQTYRIAVSTPFNSKPETAYPVVYLLDGNQYFSTAADIVTRLSYRSEEHTSELQSLRHLV